MIRIALDVMGGDNCPAAAIEARRKSNKTMEDIELILCGKEAQIKAELDKLGADTERISILDAQEEIDCHEQPTAAIRRRETSMVKALNLVAKGEADAVVSSGSTGALLAGATLIVKKDKGRKASGSFAVAANGKGRLDNAYRLRSKYRLQAAVFAAVRRYGFHIYAKCYGHR